MTLGPSRFKLFTLLFFVIPTGSPVGMTKTIIAPI